MSQSSRRWGAYNTKHPEKYIMKEIACISNKFNHTKKIKVKASKAKYVRKAFELYATGEYPLSEIRRIINAAGLVGKKDKVLSVSNYQYMLKNPLYYGVIRYNGELYDGKHEPIITKKLFDKCQEVMRQKSKPKGRKLKPYIYRGIFRCGECGCFITTETQKGHNYLKTSSNLFCNRQGGVQQKNW